MVISIRMANAGSLRGFETAIETVSGKTSLEILSSGPGLDEMRLADLSWLNQFGQMSPLVDGAAFFTDSTGSNEVLRVLGVDILRDRSFREYHLLEFERQQREPTAQEFLALLMDPQSVIMTEKFAARNGIKIGSAVRMTLGDRIQTFVVRGLLRNEGPARVLDGNFLLMDIAAAQLALDHLGVVDRLEIMLLPNSSIDGVEQAIQARLPAGLQVQRPARRGHQVEKMLEAFHFNLSALSYIALLVGLFLIYNTVSISVISRRREIGILRALGVTRAAVARLFLLEAGALAATGCVLGLPLGRLLAFGAMRITATTVSTLYIATAAQPDALDWNYLLLAFAVGVPLALIAATVPALEAARVPPVAAMHGSDLPQSRFRLPLPSLLFSISLFALAGWLSTLKPLSGKPIFGYCAAVAIVFGAAFLSPSVLLGLGRFGARPLFSLFKVEGKLAVANLTGAIPRIAISVAALAVSLSMMVAIAVMIGSFRETLIYWVEQTLQADLYVRPATRSNPSVNASISPEVVAVIQGHGSVEAVDRFRNFDIPYEDGLITLGAGDLPVLLKHGRLLMKEPAGRLGAARAAIGQDAVLISESFSIKFNKHPGDEVWLPLPSGSRSFRIVAVYYDYSSDRGVVVMDRSTFVRYFGEIPPSSLAVFLRAGVSPEGVRSDILRSLEGKHRIFIHTNASLRSEVLRIFDSTFAITYALELIAIFVAILGVASTLFTLILERKRELALLRMVGADRRQVRKMVVIEALLLGGVSQFIGVGVGLLLSLVLIYVINVQSFGWTIQFHLPLSFLIQSSLLILGATVLAGLFPARQAIRMHAVEQLAEE